MSLTIEQSVEIGVKNSHRLHSSQMTVQAAEARSGVSGAARLPSLKFGASYTRLSDVPPFSFALPAGTFGPQQPPLNLTLSPIVLNNYNLKLSLQQPLFTGFRLEGNNEAAGLNAEATKEDFERDKADVVYTIKSAYWNYYKAGEFKKVVDENVEQGKLHLEEVRNLMRQGMATTNDVLRVQVQLSSTELTQIEANNNVHIAMLTLNNIIGLPITNETGISSAPDSTLAKDSANVASLVASAIEKRPELKSLQFRVDAGEAGVKAAKSGWYPQIFLSGNYYYSRPNLRYQPTEDRFRDTWDIGLNASMDIWNGGTTSRQTEEAEAQLALSRDAFYQTKDAISLEVTQAFLTLQQSMEKIGVSEKGVAAAVENNRVTNEKFKMGLSLNSDVLDAEVTLLQAKWNHIQSLVDYEIAKARLEKSIGR
ncbi:MAG TPA: TolC family protein [Bacteroidota bacterium]|nr:TolC family protein [Bacteroidota bacterium]